MFNPGYRTRSSTNYHIYSIKRPGRFIKFLDLEGGRLFEAGRLLNFHHFKQAVPFFIRNNV